MAPQALQDERGDLHYHPECMAQIFRKYFSNLYNNPSIPNLPPAEGFCDRVWAYLFRSSVVTLSASALGSLNATITEVVVEETLKLLLNDHLTYVQMYNRY